MGELGGKRALTNAGCAHDPEEAAGSADVPDRLRPRKRGCVTCRTAFLEWRFARFEGADSEIGAPSAPPLLHRLEQPLASVEAFLEKIIYSRVSLYRFEMPLERFDLTGKAAAFVALNHPDDLGELGLIPLLPRRVAGCAALLPFVHVEPLDVTDVHGHMHLLLALDEDGLDVAAFHTDGDGDLIAADTWVAGGMFGEEGDELVAPRDSFRDRASPVVARLDLALVEPDVVPALFEVGFDTEDQLLVGVVAVAEEDP